MLTIAIIGLQPIIRSGLILILKDYFNKVTILESDSPMSFIIEHRNSNIDLITFVSVKNKQDYDISFLSIGRNFSGIKRLVLFNEPPEKELLTQYLNTGMHGYLTCNYDISEILDCYDRVLKGEFYITNEMLNSIIAMATHGKSNSLQSTVRLTAREAEIAQYLCMGMKNSQIASKIARKPTTISTIKKNIFTKLNVNNIMHLKVALDHIS